MSKIITYSGIINILLTIALCSTYSLSGTMVPYICVIFIFLISFFWRGIPKVYNLYEAMPAVIVFSWVYGVFIGLANNPIFVVFSNFAGMSVYLIFYSIKISKINNTALLKILEFSAKINIIYAIISISDSFFLGNSINNSIVDYSDVNATIGQFRLYWSVGIVLVIGYFTSVFAKYLTRHTLSKTEILWAMLALVAIFSTFSKGFIAQLIFSIFFIAFGVLKREKLSRIIGRYLILFLLLFVVFFLIYDSNYVNAFNGALESEFVEGSREEQRHFLINEFSFLGGGLGAPLKSGYSRDSLGYSFELNFENLIHKIGIFSMVVFFCYSATIFLIFKRYLKDGDANLFGLSLGLTFYLIPAYGNPILFAPTLVIVHCIVIFLNSRNTLRKII